MNLREKINEFNAISRGFRAALELSEAIEKFLDGEAELGSHQAAITKAKADLIEQEKLRAEVLDDLANTQSQLENVREQLIQEQSKAGVEADKIVKDATVSAETMIAKVSKECDEIIRRAKNAAKKDEQDTEKRLRKAKEELSDLNAEIEAKGAELAETQAKIEKNNQRIAAIIEASKL